MENEDEDAADCCCCCCWPVVVVVVVVVDEDDVGCGVDPVARLARALGRLDLALKNAAPKLLARVVADLLKAGPNFPPSS